MYSRPIAHRDVSRQTRSASLFAVRLIMPITGAGSGDLALSAVPILERPIPARPDDTDDAIFEASSSLQSRITISSRHLAGQDEDLDFVTKR